MRDLQEDESAISERTKTPWYTIVVEWIMAVGCFGAMAWLGYDSITLVQNGKPSLATCTRIDVKQSGSGSNRSTSRTFHVTYPVEGQGTLQGTVSGTFTGLKEGGTIEVLYDPQNPSRVETNHWFSLWGTAAIFGAGGLAFLSALVWPKRRKPKRPARVLRNDPVDHQQSVAHLARKTLRYVTYTIGGLLLAGAGIWGYATYFGGHTLPVQVVAVSADGARFVSAAGDDSAAEIIVWDAQQQSRLTLIKADGGTPTGIQFAGDDESLAVMSCRIARGSTGDYPPNQIFVVDLKHAEILADFPEPDWPAQTLVLPTSDRLVMRSSDSVALFDLHGKQLHSLLAGRQLWLRGAAINANETVLAVSGQDQVHMFDVTTQTTLPSLVAKGSYFDELAINSNGDQVAVSLEPQSAGQTPEQTEFPVYVWDRQSGDVKTIKLEHPATHLKFVPGQPERLLVASGRNYRHASVAVYSLQGEELQELYSGSAVVDWWNLSTDGSRLLFDKHEGGNGVELWDLSQSPANQIWIKQPFRLSKPVLSPDNQTLIGHRWPSVVAVANAVDGTPVFEIQGFDASSWYGRIGWCVAGVILFAGASWGAYGLSHGASNGRKTLMGTVAEQLGWIQQSDATATDFTDFDFMKSRSGGRFEQAVMGQSLGIDTRLGIFSWLVETEKGKRSARELCVIYTKTNAGVPDLYIYPENIASRIAALAGGQDVDLDNTQSLSEFSAKYVLRTPEPDRMPSVISNELADQLCANLGWSIEIVDGSILLWWQRVKSFRMESSPMRSAASVLKFQSDAEAIVKLLLRS